MSTPEPRVSRMTPSGSRPRSSLGRCLPDASGGRGRRVDPAAQAEHPDAEAQRGAEQGNTGLVAPAFSATTATAEQRGDGVELAAQDRGRLVEQDVAQHPAPDAGDRT